MNALRHHFWVAGLALVIAGPGMSEEPPKVRSQAPTTPPTKEQLDKLLKLYRAYELPEPPADATLVRTETGARSYHDGKYTDHIGLGFLIKAKKPGDRDRILWPLGQLDEIGRRQKVAVVKPTPAALEGVDSFVGTELAVLCYTRGWTELALKILENPLNDLWPPSENELANWAWGYWPLQFQRNNADRTKVDRVLKLALENRTDEHTIHDRKILESLESSLVPSKAKPGTIEALIDGLIEVDSTDQTAAFGGPEPHPAYVAVARRGFDAVPALLEHLNDERLTRAHKQGFNNFRGYDYTVTDVVCDLLQGLAGEEVGKDWLRRLQGYRLEKTDIEKWWAAAQKVGEEAYFVEHVLDGSDEGNLHNRLMADVLAHKYPKRLPEVYRRMLKERPKMFGWELGRVVEQSTLPKETKRDLFLEAAKSTGAEVRVYGLGSLLRVDPVEGRKILLAELDRMPRTPAREYWACPEVRLAGLAASVNDPVAWNALERTARQVDAGLRLEILNHMAARDLTEAERKARLRFLARFLDDATVRDTSDSPGKYEGPYAGFTGPARVEVRNFAAEQLAWLLDLDAEPKKDWTAGQWAKLRDDVKKALAREGIR